MIPFLYRFFSCLEGLPTPLVAFVVVVVAGQGQISFNKPKKWENVAIFARYLSRKDLLNQMITATANEKKSRICWRWWSFSLYIQREFKDITFDPSPWLQRWDLEDICEARFCFVWVRANFAAEAACWYLRTKGASVICTRRWHQYMIYTEKHITPR